MSLLVTTLVFGYLSLPYKLWYGFAGGLLGGVISGKGAARFHLRGIGSLFVQQWRKVGLLSVWAGGFLGGLVVMGFALPGNSDSLYDGVIYGSSLGLCGCVLTMLVVLGKQAAQQTISSVPRSYWWHRVLPHGLQADVLRLGVLAGLLLGLSNGLSNGLSFGAIGVFLSLLLLGKTGTIELAERLVWSRKQIRGGLLSKHHLGASAHLFRLLFLFLGLSYGLSYGLSAALSIGSAYWLLLGLWNGLSRETLDDHLRTRPNQGILRSVRSAFLVGGLTGIICFLVGPLYQFIFRFFFDGISEALSYGLSTGLSYGLSWGLSVGIFLGCTGFLLAALLTGGLASLRHVLLRMQLRHLGVVPRHYVRFLDDATRRILLYKDGGGYRFIHRLFLDYFADLEAEPSRASSAAQGTGITQEQANGVTAEPHSS